MVPNGHQGARFGLGGALIMRTCALKSVTIRGHPPDSLVETEPHLLCMLPYKLRCFIAGGCSHFSIRIDPSEELGYLRWLIYDSQKKGLPGVPEGGLMLFQVRRSGLPWYH
jgi:hypothetical protein